MAIYYYIINMYCTFTLYEHIISYILFEVNEFSKLIYANYYYGSESDARMYKKERMKKNETNSAIVLAALSA